MNWMKKRFPNLDEGMVGGRSVGIAGGRDAGGVGVEVSWMFKCLRWVVCACAYVRACGFGEFVSFG
jgi:hypothetical protein